MKNKPLSFYIRKKIQHRFFQNTFHNPEQFISFLKEHKINIDKRMLEKWEKEGWLRPAFRVVLTEELQKLRHVSINMNLDICQKDGLIEFPREGDYEPWDSFRHDYKKGENYDKKIMYYHPFQIMQVLTIIEFKKIAFYWVSEADKLIQNFSSRVHNRIQVEEKIFNNKIRDLESMIGFLMILEEAYRFFAFGRMSSNHSKSRNNFKAWHKWRTTKFSAKKLIQQYNADVSEIQELYEEISDKAYNMDPLAKWYDLTRIVKHYRIDDLKGEALTAQLYYCMSRLLSHLYYDLTKNTMSEPNEGPSNLYGEWKKTTYSDPFDYATKETQRGILRFFMHEPTTRIFLLVEGNTEEEIITRIFSNLYVNPKDDGIFIINCRGIDNMRKGKLVDYIEMANQDHISMYFLADNEKNSNQKVKEIEQHIKTDFKYHIWKKNFEEDNFGKKKIINWFKIHMDRHNKRLENHEIKKQEKHGVTLIKAIENAYREKYRGNVWKITPYEKEKKMGMSLELFEPRLKKISYNRKSGKPYEIENVLDEVFKMITTWR